MMPADFDLTRGAVTLMPSRPRWDYELKRGKLHSRERRAFVRWIADVKQRLIASGAGYAPAFEQNIEVWVVPFLKSISPRRHLRCQPWT